MLGRSFVRRSCVSISARARGRAYSSTAADGIDGIRALQAAFRDPGSPLYLPPGTVGPATPDVAVDEDDVRTKALREGKELLTKRGFDPDSFWEQPVVWGELDSFQHLNNVHYVRYIETGRMKWLSAVMHELGGAERVRAMLKGQGISFILKSISLQYRRPVTYPDTLLIAHKPHLPNAGPDSTRWPKSYFHLAGAVWSCAQRAVVTDADSVIVWYDYDTLKKCDPGAAARESVWQRIEGSSKPVDR